MNKDNYKLKVKELIQKSKEKGLIKTYEEFLETDEAKEYALVQEEVEYYTSNNKKLNKYKIGDIVFVSKYKYKSGNDGENHSFVIIDEEQAIDINYFGFLLSSQTKKASFSFNEVLNKNEFNKLKKDSIVKCDDLITILEEDIKFKIGEVTEEELERFINAYDKYLESK